MSLKSLRSNIKPLLKFQKKIKLPASKSHANRALILAATIGDDFKVKNISDSSDVTHLLTCFKEVGLKFTQEADTLIFHNAFPECEKETPNEEIHLQTGDGGTTNRFLLALLSRGKKRYYFYPTEKMMERPMEDLINPLKKMDVDVTVYSEKEHEAWLSIKGPASMYNTTQLEIDCGKSTQFASAMMLAFANLPLTIETKNVKASEQYLQMTHFVIKEARLNHEYMIPVDYSSASYPCALAAVMGEVTIENAMKIDNTQADSIFLDLLGKIGASVNFTKKGLMIKKGVLSPFHFSVKNAPDLFPTLVFLAAHIQGQIVLTDLEVLTFKESDRLKEMKRMMDTFGVSYQHYETLDQLVIKGNSDVKYPSANFEPARDHRIVMASALMMAKNSGGELENCECVEKSYTNFFQLLME